MERLQRFVYPESLDEALALLAQGREKARAIAGGTSVIFFKGKGTEALVDITRLGLDKIRPNGNGLGLGACVRLQTLADSPLLAEPGLAALADAARRAGPRAVRNAITLGGNVAGYKRWSDLPMPLMALGARAEIAGHEGSRQLDVTKLLERHPITQLQPGELITGFVVPSPPAGAGSAYVKFTRTAIDYALASAAARVVMEDGRCTAATLVLGSVSSYPVSVGWIAEVLTGQAVDEERLSAVAERVTGEVEPRPDLRVSTAYLKDLAGVVARDALALAARRAQGEESDA